MCAKADGADRNEVFEQLKCCGLALDYCFKAAAAGLDDVRVSTEGELLGRW